MRELDSSPAGQSPQSKTGEGEMVGGADSQWLSSPQYHFSPSPPSRMPSAGGMVGSADSQWIPTFHPSPLQSRGDVLHRSRTSTVTEMSGMMGVVNPPWSPHSSQHIRAPRMAPYFRPGKYFTSIVIYTQIPRSLISYVHII